MRFLKHAIKTQQLYQKSLRLKIQDRQIPLSPNPGHSKYIHMNASIITVDVLALHMELDITHRIAPR